MKDHLVGLPLHKEVLVMPPPRLSQLLEMMKNQHTHIHLNNFIQLASLSSLRLKIDLRAAPTISIIILQTRLLNKKLKRFGYIIKIRYYKIRGEKKS
jgi:hypothetical protein